MKGRLIIFEGPDACGKTTASQDLANKLNAAYFHVTCTSLLAPAMRDYQMNVLENVKVNLDQGKHVVLDRLWPSELCYGSHFRGIAEDDIRELIDAAEALDPLMVFCLDAEGVEAATERHRQHLDVEHPYSDENFRVIYRNYEKLVQTWDHRFKSKAMLRLFDKTMSPENACNQCANAISQVLFSDPHLTK